MVLHATEIARRFDLGGAAQLSDGPVARGKQGLVWRLETGAVEWVSRAWEPHPECGCLGLPA